MHPPPQLLFCGVTFRSHYSHFLFGPYFTNLRFRYVGKVNDFHHFFFLFL